jgi:tRNA threonylcarbamoyladenosine biosynthesis protein TsaE
VHIKTMSEAQTQAVAARLSAVCKAPLLITFSGELGAGKTTFIRGLLRGCGVTGAIKSPSYGLIEPYARGDATIYHMDLYRLTSAEELEFIGFRDYLSDICLIEWPERAAGYLPTADVEINMQSVEGVHEIFFKANTPKGEALLKEVNHA